MVPPLLATNPTELSIAVSLTSGPFVSTRIAILSETFLVKGKVARARDYYDLSIKEVKDTNTRADWFYSGSVLYAVKDYSGIFHPRNKL